VTLTPVPAPVVLFNSDVKFDVLGRPIISQANVGIVNDIYAEALNTSLDFVNLSLLGLGLGGTNTGTPPANLSPSQLGGLEPAAGGNPPTQGAAPNANDAACANAYLDSEWSENAADRDCNTERQPQI
jgi:hypothetical protein